MNESGYRRYRSDRQFCDARRNSVALAADDTPFVGWRRGLGAGSRGNRCRAAREPPGRPSHPSSRRPVASWTNVYPRSAQVIRSMAPDSRGHVGSPRLRAVRDPAGALERSRMGSRFRNVGSNSQTSTAMRHGLDRGRIPVVSWILPADRGTCPPGRAPTWTAARIVADMTEPYIALDSGRNPMIVTGGSGIVRRSAPRRGRHVAASPAAAVPPQACIRGSLPVLTAFRSWPITTRRRSASGWRRWTGKRWDTRAFAFGPANAGDAAPQLVVGSPRHGLGWLARYRGAVQPLDVELLMSSGCANCSFSPPSP